MSRPFIDQASGLGHDDRLDMTAILVSIKLPWFVAVEAEEAQSSVGAIRGDIVIAKPLPRESPSHHHEAHKATWRRPAQP